MNLNVAQLLKDPIGSTRTDELQGSFIMEDTQSMIDCDCQMILMRTDKGVWMTAQCGVALEATCSRCLGRFSYSADISISEEFLPTIDINTGQSIGFTDSTDGSFTLDAQHGLDMSEALRQYSITHQPMKPLCNPNCKGLCGACGENLNNGSCTCQDLQGGSSLKLGSTTRPQKTQLQVLINTKRI